MGTNLTHRVRVSCMNAVWSKKLYLLKTDQYISKDQGLVGPKSPNACLFFSWNETAFKRIIYMFVDLCFWSKFIVLYLTKKGEFFLMKDISIWCKMQIENNMFTSDQYTAMFCITFWFVSTWGQNKWMKSNEADNFIGCTAPAYWNNSLYMTGTIMSHV